VVTSFIETQFPISRLSAESYKERKAGASQTLTGLGKWWGRKPLILVRASILGMLMPASDDPQKDRDVFLKILTMDDQGVWDRCKASTQRKFERINFDSLPYAERITFCDRPENVSGPSLATWKEINDHLKTNAKSLEELIQELGRRQFGRMPRVGDSFCGGGSIPFEAARIGCEAYGSDLNPVAGMLTWASLNILGGDDKLRTSLRESLIKVYDTVNDAILNWGVETSEYGERAEAFLYCTEVRPDGCDYFIPLAPSWLVSEKYGVVVDWVREGDAIRLTPIVKEVSPEELKSYKKKKGATVSKGRIIDPFDESRSWSVESVRGHQGLRHWENSDLTPRKEDVFQERVYCIRWVDDNGIRRFAAPTEHDEKNEAQALELLSQRFEGWQHAGYIPSKLIDKGYNTEQPLRERGWRYWHHLFTPRQLLMYGLYLETTDQLASIHSKVSALLKLGIQINWNSKLCIWNPDKSKGPGATEQTFANQALNTLFNFGTRSFGFLKESLTKDFSFIPTIGSSSEVVVLDARDINQQCDLWITDPPYADAVNYHELGDFFLSWYQKKISENFRDWVPDARAELAVRGDGDDFRRSMVDVYKNLTNCMPDDGMQLVMFTHQNPAVWADLGMILWAAGLSATAAWTISTETSAGLKQGNYVQGTVCLVLRKRLSSRPGFLDEVFPLVEDEVKKQIISMQNIDAHHEPNFNDADYQLAAYAAALKVLTQYGNLDGRDVEHEVFATRPKDQKSDFQIVIERALNIACNTLIPDGLQEIWRDLSLVERYYLRALDIESRGERRKGMYEELARGFGITEIKALLKSDKANGTRMLTPSAFKSSFLASPDRLDEVQTLDKLSHARTNRHSTHPFATSALRHLLFAISETSVSDFNPEIGRQYLRDTFGAAYWEKRDGLVRLLSWIARLSDSEGMDEWSVDSESAKILAGRLRTDHA
jgi:putative DNA methylase